MEYIALSLIKYSRASGSDNDFLAAIREATESRVSSVKVKDYGSKVPAVTVTVFKYRNKIGKIVVKAVPYSVT
jgi:hypothetical protein